MVTIDSCLAVCTRVLPLCQGTVFLCFLAGCIAPPAPPATQRRPGAAAAGGYLVKSRAEGPATEATQDGVTLAHDGSFAVPETDRRRLERELQEKELAHQTLLESLRILKESTGAEIAELQQRVASEKQEARKWRDQAVKSEFQAVEAARRLETLRLELMQKRTLFEARYPVYYEVAAGDSLWRIAARDNIYKNPYKWTEIYYANQEKIPDPERIFPGQILKIPRYFEFMMDSFDSEWDSLFPGTHGSVAPAVATPSEKPKGVGSEAGWEDFL